MKSNNPIVLSQQSGDDLHGSRFAGAVGTEKTDNFARRNSEGNILNRGNAAIAFENALEFQHSVSPTTRSHSFRNAEAGCTRIPARAGSRIAAAATTHSTIGTATNASMS